MSKDGGRNAEGITRRCRVILNLGRKGFDVRECSSKEIEAEEAAIDVEI